MTTTWHVWYTDEHVVTLLAEHTILLPGRRPHINFHVCVLHLKNIHTIVSSLQNTLGVRSLQQLAFRVCIMAITRAGAIAAAAKAGQVSVSKSRENEKGRKSAASTRKWRERQSAEQRSEIRQTDQTGHADGRACLSEEQ